MQINRSQTHSPGETWSFRKVAQTVGVALLAFTEPAAAVVTSRKTRLHGVRPRPHHDASETHLVDKSLEALWLPFETPQPQPLRVHQARVIPRDDWMQFETPNTIPGSLVDHNAVGLGAGAEETMAVSPPLPPRNSSLLSQPAPVLQCVDGGTLSTCPPPIIPDPALQAYLAMCVIVRDEPWDLPEWIDHYRELGADAFYIFDHNSSQPLRPALESSASTSHIGYRYFNDFTGDDSAQVTVYNTCIRDYGDKHRFIGFVDSDEYLIPRKGPKQLVEFLREYEDAGALAVNWRQFGSSGHIERPAGRVVDNYVFCYAADSDNNKHVKLFGNMLFMDRMQCPHTALYTDERFAVNENMVRVDGPFTKTISMQKYVLHHYVTRSLEDFERKVARGTAHGAVSKDIGFFKGVNKEAKSLCLAGRKKDADDGGGPNRSDSESGFL